MDLKLWRHAEAEAAVPGVAKAGRPDESGAVMLVGHMPGLGQLAALLLSGSEGEWTIKKAGVWWFSNRVRHDETQTILRTVANP